MQHSLGVSIQRVEDGAGIPVDMGNADYIAYLEWINNGNVAPVTVFSIPDASDYEPKIDELRGTLEKLQAQVSQIKPAI